MKDKKFLKEVITILIVGAIINGFCFFVCSITGHCANVEQEYYPFSWGYNEIGRQEDIETIIGYMSDTNSQWYGYDHCFIRAVKEDHGSYYTIYYATEFFGDYYNLYGVVNDQQPYVFDVYRGTNNQGTQRYTTATFAFGFNGTQRLEYVFNSANFSGSQSSLYNSIISYYSTFDTLYDANGNALIYTPIEDVPIGEFTDLPGLDQILDNISNTFNNFTNTNLPQNDSNLSDSANIRNFLDTLQSNISNSIGNLGSSLISAFNNLQRKLTDVANSISLNIHNGFATLMQNIKDFISPKLDYIIERLNYITADVDPVVIQEFFESTTAYTDISSIQTSLNTFVTSFTGVSEPDDYIITFHIEDISIFNQSDPFYLHLNILNPVKSYIRGFLWVVVSYGIFISIIDSLPNYINGGGGEDD